MDDDDDEKFGSTWLEAFKNLFKPISESDIDNYKKEYVGSELEKNDLKKAYLNGKGCINFIMSHVPFMDVEDEPRFHDIVNEWIKSGEVPDFKAFTNEPKAKRDRRHKKYAKEAKEAEKIKAKEKNDENDLAKMIALRQTDRAKGFNSFMDKLAQKYGNEDLDDDEELDEESVKKFGKKLQKNSNKKKKATISKPKKESPIQSGRVSKK